MALLLRDATRDDLPFLREMLYEAVYWRSISQKNNPPFDEGLAAPGVDNVLDGWGEREGDIAVIADHDSVPAGAAWYRFYNTSNAIRGYIDEITPAIVLAVDRGHRRRGIGTKLLACLIERASERGINRLSLMVSNDNHAYGLYEKLGFRVEANVDSSRLMVRDV